MSTVRRIGFPFNLLELLMGIIIPTVFSYANEDRLKKQRRILEKPIKLTPIRLIISGMEAS